MGKLFQNQMQVSEVMYHQS